MMQDKRFLEATIRVLNACADLSLEDRLLALQFGWMVVAHEARNTALGFPGGFQAEQARQTEQLEKATLLVSSDTPDLEMERIIQDGDLEAAMKYLQAKLREEGGH